MQSILKNILSYMLLFLLLGCSLIPQSESVALAEMPSDEYRSYISSEPAKAMFAYAEFRLLAVEERWDEALAALESALVLDSESSYLRLTQARVYLHLERLDEAVEVLNVQAQMNPENSEVYELLGEIYSYEGRYPAAVEAFRSASELEPQNEDFSVRLALALFQTGELQDAVILLEEVVADSPDADLARLSLARFYYELGRSDEALSEYRQIFEGNPALQSAVLEYGELLELQDDEAAVALYREALRYNANASEIRRRLVQIYLDQEKTIAALTQLELLLEQIPGDAQAIAQTGLLYLELGRWRDAEDAFLELRESGVYQQRSLYYLALAQEEMGLNSEAILNLEKITEDSSVYAEASLQLSYLYRLSGRLDEAFKRLESLVEAEPYNTSAYYYLIALLLEERSPDAALPVALEAMSANPQESSLAYQIAIIYERKNNRDESVAWMKTVLDLDPDHVEALNFLAYHQAEYEIDLDLALTRVQRALSLEYSGHIVDTLGWVFFKMGRFQESMTVLEEATAMMPYDPYVAEHLADVYAALELWDAAKTVYLYALSLDPDFQSVRDKLNNLKSLER